MLNKLLIILALSGTLTATSANAAENSKPNVIFFAFDDLNDRIGPMGFESAITPNLDRLAKMGVTFTNAHCPATYCAPSRTAIFTGRYATTTGAYRTQVYYREHPELIPLQQSFKNGGYKTFGGGKLFHHREGFIDRRGWDEFFLRSEKQKLEGWPLDSWGDDTPYPEVVTSHQYDRGWKPRPGKFLDYAAIPNDKEEEMADTKRVNWACSILQEEHDEPFFLAVGIYAPHYPNFVPQKYFDMYPREQVVLPDYLEGDLDDVPQIIRKGKLHRKKIYQDKLVELGILDETMQAYMASVTYADAMFGRVLDALENSPYRNNTIIVIWSDHGYHQGEKGDWGKHTLWERTSNVPFIWAGPEIAKDQKVSASVSLIDMFPTFQQMCGLPNDDGLEGVSLASVLRDPQSAKDRNVFLPYLDPNAYAVINEDWRYIHYKDGSEELYNVREDPNEWHNLALKPEYAPVIKELKQSAPQDHAAPGIDKPELRLVMNGEDYSWEKK